MLYIENFSAIKQFIPVISLFNCEHGRRIWVLDSNISFDAFLTVFFILLVADACSNVVLPHTVYKTSVNFFKQKSDNNIFFSKQSTAMVNILRIPCMVWIVHDNVFRESC